MHTDSLIVDNRAILALPPDAITVRTERDVLDLVARCGEHNTQRLLCHAANFAPEFFDLKTGLAGIVFQKFATYSITAAMVIDPATVTSQRFRELMLESNKGRHFRFFTGQPAAEEWLQRI
jgi:hypothetical protein